MVGARVLGVGLAAALAAVTLALAITGRLGLYINPESSWFAVSMAVLALVGAVVSFALPLGAEADHGHDHGHAPAHASSPRSGSGSDSPRPLGPRSTTGPRSATIARSASGDDHDHHDDHHGHANHRERTGILPATAATVGGILAAGIVATIVVVPPAALSAELAMSRDTGAPPLFQGADDIALAATGDTSSFGVGEWASVFATTTNPEAFDGDPVTLTGFVTPADDGGFLLARLVITHCVIDAQSASIPVSARDAPATGEWVTITGTVRDVDGRLQVRPTSVEAIDQPKDPYEY